MTLSLGFLKFTLIVADSTVYSIKCFSSWCSHSSSPTKFCKCSKSLSSNYTFANFQWLWIDEFRSEESFKSASLLPMNSSSSSETGASDSSSTCFSFWADKGRHWAVLSLAKFFGLRKLMRSSTFALYAGSSLNVNSKTRFVSSHDLSTSVNFHYTIFLFTFIKDSL